MNKRLFLFIISLLALGAAGVPVASAQDVDTDGDGLTDSFETTYGTDPTEWDTDGDTVTDLYDCAPLDPERSMPDDCNETRIVRRPFLPPQSPDLVDPNSGPDAVPNTEPNRDGIPSPEPDETILFAEGGGGCSLLTR